MVRLIQFKDPNSAEMEERLRKLPRCPGTCIFIDIVSSTEVKYTSDVSQWGKRLNNTFNFISFLNDFPDNIVKGIGDEMMLYIPDRELKKKGYINTYYSLIEEIYSTIHNLQSFPRQDLFYQCQVALHYCREVYNVTFLKGFNDYYGRDIDLTARLKVKTRANRLVFSEEFYKKVSNEMKRSHIPRESTCMNQVSIRFTDDFKGIPHPVSYRFIDV